MTERPDAENGLANLGRSMPLVPPLFQSSVYTLPDLDVLDRILNGEEPGYIYARDSHPNARYLADELARWEGGDWAVICGSGMAALTALFLSLLKQGEHILASNRLYGRTTQLLMEELPRYGVETTLVDACDLDKVQAAFRKPFRVLFVETMSNPLVRLVDVAALAQLAHDHDCLLIVDNTFATPVLLRPLELGADFVMESLTKMMGGHSDVTLGGIAGRGDWLPALSRTVSIWGLACNPFDAWLAERGLATLRLRMRQACANAAALAEWLTRQPAVAQVVYPGLADHPDHELAQRQLGNLFGNMLCFELRGGRDAVNYFLREARGIPFSPSLGHIRTTCSHPSTTSHRYVSPAEKTRQGISDGLIRLSVGIEELAAICQELQRGLR